MTRCKIGNWCVHDAELILRECHIHISNVPVFLVRGPLQALNDRGTFTSVKVKNLGFEEARRSGWSKISSTDCLSDVDEQFILQPAVEGIAQVLPRWGVHTGWAITIVLTGWTSMVTHTGWASIIGRGARIRDKVVFRSTHASHCLNKFMKNHQNILGDACHLPYMESVKFH